MDKIPHEMKALIMKFLERDTTPEETATLQAWLQESDLHRKYFDELNETYQASISLGRFNPERVDAAWQRLRTRIHDDDQSKRRFLLPTFTFLKVAATIALLVAVGYVLQRYIGDGTHTGGARVFTAQNLNTRVLLPDGSTVWLNANSTLAYDADFGTTHRKVVLTGEAFFDVEKSKKDFIVTTKNIAIYVKGTRFNVRAYNGDPDVRTTLEEGKVELMVDGDKERYAMRPGDQITVDATLRKVFINKVNPSNYSAWKEEKLVFDNTPLSEIVLKLENRYRVKIVIDQALAQREHLTMTIEHETIDEVLELIRLSSQVKFRKDKDTIIMYE